jgi:hypothetical protein
MSLSHRDSVALMRAASLRRLGVHDESIDTVEIRHAKQPSTSRVGWVSWCLIIVLL